MSVPRIERLGEDALLLRLGDDIDPQTNLRIHTLAARLTEERPAWLRDIVPAYAALALFVDAASGDGDPLDPAEAWLRARLSSSPGAAPDADQEIVEIPVCYGGDLGPDLASWAAHAGLAPDEAIARHAAGDYRVAMLGFAPGFPYLLGLEAALAMPRMDNPRTRVPAGSVAIGGAQTGIYPRESPGGWRVIGRTPLRLFDAARDEPSLLWPGQRVRFATVDRARYARLADGT